MIYKPYGTTNKSISAIGMGGMRFKKEDYADGELGKCAEIVLKAFESGINYFDTAPGYCNDKSEFIYGKAFEQMKTDGKFYVSTKCSLRNAKDADGARRMIEQSLKRLKVDKIDFYNMWCILRREQYDEFIKRGGVYEGACKARDEGLIDHICFSTHMGGPDIAAIADDGLYEGVTLGYNAVNFAYRQKGVDACHAANMGVITMNPLGGGMIPSNPDYFSFMRRKGESLVTSALRFIITQPQITCALVGFSSVDEIEEVVKAADETNGIEPFDHRAMANFLKEELDALCTTCTYCDSCPAGLPIPQLMESYNYFILSCGDEKSVKDRLAFHWNVDGSVAAQCMECGKCELLCTQKLPIIDRLIEIKKMFTSAT